MPNMGFFLKFLHLICFNQRFATSTYQKLKLFLKEQVRKEMICDKKRTEKERKLKKAREYLKRYKSTLFHTD